MFAGFGTADDTNWRFKEIIVCGDGLSTAFDMPTLLGIDWINDGARRGRACGAMTSLADTADLRRDRP
jgi:methylmalonyl-CoA mutase N-terminal domain/subunit